MHNNDESGYAPQRDFYDEDQVIANIVSAPDQHWDGRYEEELQQPSFAGNNIDLEMVQEGYQ